MDIAGESPVINSTSGFFIIPRNCLAYEERDSTYLLCPSAYIVSKARELFPHPETPVKTTILFFGMLTETFLRLFSFAPFILINSVFISTLIIP